MKQAFQVEDSNICL